MLLIILLDALIMIPDFNTSLIQSMHYSSYIERTLNEINIFTTDI